MSAVHEYTCTDVIIRIQAMTLLNHAGVCMSYKATWEHLLSLTQQANVLRKIQTGHWIWAYDNLNVHRITRHERQGEYMYLTSTCIYFAGVHLQIEACKNTHYKIECTCIHVDTPVTTFIPEIRSTLSNAEPHITTCH